MTAAEKLLDIVKRAKRDDLERAEAGFRGLSDADMNRAYGDSGLTRKQVIEEYRRERAEWQAAYDLVKKLINSK